MHIVASSTGCPGLAEAGFQQANLLARRVQTIEDYTLLSSPALRAYQTAEAIAGENRQIIQDADLTEINTGEAEGLSWEAYEAQFGYFNPPAEPDRPFAPGGESWNQYQMRVRATLDRLALTYAGQTVLAVTHAGFIVAAMLVLFEIPGTGKGWLEPRYTSLTEWQVTPERWTLVRYNDDLHLQENML
jgi:broad specificity phosphatase PhoE